MVDISINTGNLQEQIDQLSTLIEKLGLLENKTQMLTFINIQQFAKITGWSIATVQDLFNRKDFPSCDFGKTKIAELTAVQKYFSVPRRK